MRALDCPACRKPMREVSHPGVLIDNGGPRGSRFSRLMDLFG